ncbi:hypothetical protein Rsub_08030 [Raphidocelis subcapitata]|uniref:Uncharacterized protein n=1 Tax=Raphidocelis subcapitata TaxID=307507 RepID=A0A2V0P4R7_9CHLO|nr:hypothetical protein Rsub_08030 [Raphidocelis subcapitata]|eukprot:GBF94858.1 hypothetical protein Rsub_08030 [Raphidocelis subcapitata]
MPGGGPGGGGGGSGGGCGGHGRGSSPSGAAAARPAGPGKRPPGRPPKAAGEYSKQYLRLKQYRQRQKDGVAGLNAEVQSKMQEINMLCATNQALQAREAILQDLMASEGAAGRGDLAGAAQNEAAGGAGGRRSEGGSGAPGDGPQSDGSLAKSNRPASTCPLDNPGNRAGSGGGSGDACLCASGSDGGADGGQPPPSGPANGDGQPPPSGPANGDGQPPPSGPANGDGQPAVQRSPHFQQLVDGLHLSYARCGAIAPRCEDDAAGMEHMRVMLQHYMSLSPEEAYLFLGTNMETGEVVGELPEGFWARVATGLELQPGQDARLSAALDLFEVDMGKLMAERRQLQSELAKVMGPPEAGGGVDARGEETLSAAEREELLALLQSNMVREHRLWSTAAWTVRHLLDMRQIHDCCRLSWPFWPRLTLIAFAKLGRGSSGGSRGAGIRVPIGDAASGGAPAGASRPATVNE